LRDLTAGLIVAMIAIPMAMGFAMASRLRPEQGIVGGAVAGLVAGAQGVLVYSLYCVEMAPPFWGVWYVLGVALPTGAGALCGPWLLRW